MASHGPEGPITFEMDAASAHNIKYELIPQACTDLHAALHCAGFPIDNLMSEILSDKNLSESFDYVISHLDTEGQRSKYWPIKIQLLAKLKLDLARGTFHISPKDIRDMVVTDGPKERIVQAPKVYYRIGCHAIMVIVEKYVSPTFITNTAASIKGRGMHWLFHRIEEDYSAHPEWMQYFLSNDIEKYYDNIDQNSMMAEIRHYISDVTVLQFLDNFITLMQSGLSKGLRSSQMLANLRLSPVDHYMCSVVRSFELNGEMRYLYQRYMDDVRIWGENKRELWRLRAIYNGLIETMGHRVKQSEAIRPISEGCDFLGFVFFGTHSRVRRRIKEKAARKLGRVNSRKRRQELIGSFKGMACHADCKHLFYKLTHHQMRKFSELGVAYQPEDGKKRFPGKVVQIRSIINKPIEVHDYEQDIKTQHGEGRYLVSFRDKQDGTWAKFFTASKEMQNILDQVSDIEDGFPFETTITMEMFDGKSLPKFT